MSKPENGQDRIHREVEELLDKLDTFVPEERLAAKIRNKTHRKPSDTPGPLQRAMARAGRVSLGQLMLAGFGVILFAYFFRGAVGGATPWFFGLGLIMAGGSFIVSIARGGGARTISGGTVQKRWRGQVINYSTGPSAAARIRAWFRNRRRS